MYHGKTDKGVFTINTCHLYRVQLAEERADQVLFTENRDSIIAKLIQLTKMQEKLVDDIDIFLQYVSNIVKKYQDSKMRR